MAISILTTGIRTNTIFGDEAKLQVIEELCIELYDDSDEVVAYYYDTREEGYIIVESDGLDFIEYCPNSSSYELSKNTRYYYPAPRVILEEYDSNTYINVITGETCNKADVDFIVNSKVADEVGAYDVACEVLSATEKNGVSQRTGGNTVVEEKTLTKSTNL